MDLSIIIVNYQTYEVTKNAINSVFNYTYPFSYEIIVVDNASSDDSLSKLQVDFDKKVKKYGNRYRTFFFNEDYGR